MAAEFTRNNSGLSSTRAKIASFRDALSPSCTPFSSLSSSHAEPSESGPVPLRGIAWEEDVDGTNENHVLGQDFGLKIGENSGFLSSSRPLLSPLSKQTSVPVKSSLFMSSLEPSPAPEARSLSVLGQSPSFISRQTSLPIGFSNVATRTSFDRSQRQKRSATKLKDPLDELVEFKRLSMVAQQRSRSATFEEMEAATEDLMADNMEFEEESEEEADETEEGKIVRDGKSSGVIPIPFPGLPPKVIRQFAPREGYPSPIRQSTLETIPESLLAKARSSSAPHASEGEEPDPPSDANPIPARLSVRASSDSFVSRGSLLAKKPPGGTGSEIEHGDGEMRSDEEGPESDRELTGTTILSGRAVRLGSGFSQRRAPSDVAVGSPPVGNVVRTPFRAQRRSESEGISKIALASVRLNQFVKSQSVSGNDD